jgi:murein DD-endopeptidase MepM/ murein hydrolase activator NlpD
MTRPAPTASRPDVRGAHGLHAAHRIEIGNEPPLDLGGGGGDVDRRGVSLRWLGASVLTGLAGSALIGSAIYIALAGDTSFAELPQRGAAATPKAVGGDARSSVAARKSDKLVRSELIAAAKQAFRAPMTIRSGDREVIKGRSFVRVATNLSMTTGVHAADLPPFNTLRFFAEEAGERYIEPAPEVSDADVAVVKKDLAALAVEGSAPVMSDGDVAAQVEEERRLAGEAGQWPVSPVPAQMMLLRTMRGPDAPAAALGYAKAVEAPFSALEVRVVPENVTTLAKLEPRGAEPTIEERDLMLRRGDTLDTVLRANEATPDQIRSIVSALGGRARVAALPEGQRLRVLLAPGLQPGEGRQVARVILFGERGIEGIAAANDRGAFVSVAAPVEEGARPAAGGAEEEDEDENSSVPRLYESLYETILKHELPKSAVEDLIRIFGWDVDFQRRVSAADHLELFYALDDDSGGRPEILSAALTVGGETRRVFRFHAPEEGSVEYFDEQGRSLKKFLLRKPMAEGILRSGFGYRRHPILGYSKMHTGVDWATRIGTPIISAGNGTVIKAEWDGGYGRRVEVQHANGYVTAYSHQSRFASGVRAGARVRQGQVIGYVGNTGLSTGPHLHYEVVVNGHFVDPMKIRVPRGKELDGRALAEFKRQREQVEGLIAKAGSTRLAQGDVR